MKEPAPTFAKKKRRIPPFILKLGLFATSFATCVFMVECSMIVFEPSLPSQGRYVYDEDLGFRMNPQSLKVNYGTNAFGFRDKDYPPKKPGQTRVMILGDSFNWASRINYIDRVRDLAKKEFGDDVDVLNVGYPMLHTAQELEVLKKFGLEQEPDVVILSFFTGNDFIDGHRDRKRVVLNDCFYDIHKDEEWSLFGYPMVSRLRSFTYVQQKWKVLTSVAVPPPPMIQARKDPTRVLPRDASRDAADLLGLSPAQIKKGLEVLSASVGKEDIVPGFTKDAYIRLVGQRMEFSRGKTIPRPYQDRVDYILESIEAMAKLLEQKSIRFYVGIFPHEFHISPKLRAAACKARGTKEADYDVHRAQDILRGFLKSKGIEYFDFTSIMSIANTIRPVCNPDETHYNIYGNAVIAYGYWARFVQGYLQAKVGKKSSK